VVLDQKIKRREEKRKRKRKNVNGYAKDTQYNFELHVFVESSFLR
jgi:hypothetical protein